MTIPKTTFQATFKLRLLSCPTVSPRQSLFLQSDTCRPRYRNSATEIPGLLLDRPGKRGNRRTCVGGAHDSSQGITPYSAPRNSELDFARTSRRSFRLVLDPSTVLFPRNDIALQCQPVCLAGPRGLRVLDDLPNNQSGDDRRGMGIRNHNGHRHGAGNVRVLEIE